MESVVLDSSYLIALFNAKDLHHKIAISNISPKYTYCASVISITETLVTAKSNRNFERDLRIFKKLISKIVSVDEDIAIAATKVRNSMKLKTPDALISATASKIGAKLWTFDKELAKSHEDSVYLTK